MDDTRSSQYTQRLARVQGATWKRFAPNPYRAWLRRQGLGFVLDVGCGLGRSLGYLDGNGVGVDHNAEFVATARERGLQAFTPEEFASSRFAKPNTFDSLLCAHVLEHLEPDMVDGLLRSYLPYIRAQGRVVLLTPQERGYASDPTHTVFVDGDALVSIAERNGLQTSGWGSFPLPRWAGKLFIYNEFNLIADVADPNPLAATP